MHTEIRRHSRLLLLFVLLGVGTWQGAVAQPHIVDSLKRELNLVTDDTLAVHFLCELSDLMLERDLDSASMYIHEAYVKAKHANFQRGVAWALRLKCDLLTSSGDIDSAIQCCEESIKISEALHDQQAIANCLLRLSIQRRNLGATKEALLLVERATRMFEAIRDTKGTAQALRIMAGQRIDGGQISSGLEYLRRSIRLSEREHDQVEIAKCRYILGNYLSHRGPIDSAQVILEQSRTIFEAKGYLFRAAYCLRSIATTLRLQGDMQRALTYYQRSLALLTRGSDMLGALETRIQYAICISRVDGGRGLAEMKRALELSKEYGLSRKVVFCLTNLGNMYLEQSVYPSALNYLQQSLRMCETGDNPAMLSHNLSLLGLTAFRLGRTDEARTYGYRSLEIADSLGDDIERYNAYQILSLVAEIDGKYQEASRCLQRQEELAVRMQLLSVIPDINLHVGSLAGQMGLYSSELEHYLQALKWAEKLNDRWALLHTYRNLGSYYHSRGSCDAEAEQYYLKAIQLAKELKNREGMMLNYLGLSSLYCSQKKYDDAERNGKFVIALAERAGNQEGLADGLNCLAQCYVAQERFNDALPHMLRALAIRMEMKSTVKVAYSLSEIGWMYHKLGDNAAAIDHLSRALSVAEETSDFCVLNTALLRLHTVYIAIDDYKNAYQYYHRYISHRDSVQTTEDRRKCDSLMVKYETAEREREIERLESDRALQSLELARRDEALRRQDLERLQRLQEIELLSRTAELQQMDMDMTAAELRSREAETAQKEQHIQLLEKDRKLKAASLDQANMLRNGAFLGVLLILILSGVIYRHLRQRRRVSELRTAVAESRMQEAEVQALRVQAEAERKEKEVQQKFSHSLLESQEMERQRIAAELHDSLAQKLIVIQNRSQLALRQSEDAAHLARQVNEISRATLETLDEVRGISHNLRPPILDRFGIARAVEEMVDELNETSDTTWTTELDVPRYSIPPAVQINVYRIIQESVSNILRHADAAHAAIRMHRMDGHVNIEIEDDGKGFDPLDERVISGLGMKTLAERVSLLKGRMEFTARPGEGTRIFVSIPVDAETVHGGTEKVVKEPVHT